MKMCKMIPVFILLFTGYLCDAMKVTVNTTSSPYISSPASKPTADPELETTLHESDPIPERHLSTVLVAGISISVVLVLVLIIIGVWCAWKKSKVAEINSIPSDEPGVSLKTISIHENQHEWAFERVLQ